MTECQYSFLHVLRVLTVVEGDDLGVTDFPSRVHGRQSWKAVKDRIGEFMTCDFLVIRWQIGYP